MTRKLPAIHPGEILREEFLVPMKMSAGAIANKIGVPRTRIERLANEQTSVTADTALRLSKLFGNSAEFWMNLQARYDLETAEDQVSKALKKIEPINTQAAA